MQAREATPGLLSSRLSRTTSELHVHAACIQTFKDFGSEALSNGACQRQWFQQNFDCVEGMNNSAQI